MYVRYTANPKRETNDCIIRSIAKATDTPWQEVMKEMCEIAIENYTMPNDYMCAQEYLSKRRNCPEEYPRATTVAQFCIEHPSGKFVVLMEDHAMSVVDGICYDLVNCMTEQIVSYWEIID